MGFAPVLSYRPNICLRCQWRLAQQARTTRPSAKRLYATVNRTFTIYPSKTSQQSQYPIRKRLKQWQFENPDRSEEILFAFRNTSDPGDVQNQLSKLAPVATESTDSKVDERDKARGEDEDDLITIGLFLKPGDLVELNRGGHERLLAVFVRTAFRRGSDFLGMNGRWYRASLWDIRFSITGCVDPTLLQPLLPFLPAVGDNQESEDPANVPPEIAAPVRSILEGLSNEAEMIYRTNASILDRAYATLADSKRTRMITLTQIARSLLGRNDPGWTASTAALLAVRKSLVNDEYRFVSDSRSHRLTNVFAIRAKDEVQNIETVHQWIREYEEYLAVSANATSDAAMDPTEGVTFVSDFLQKARRLIAISRKHRDPNFACVGPTKVRSSSERPSPVVPFTSADTQIIDFIQAYVLTDQFAKNSNLYSASASLIIATGCYQGSSMMNSLDIGFTPPDADRRKGFLFLQEIGAISPATNPYLYDEQLMLPTVRLSRNWTLLSEQAERIRNEPDFHDSMADVRRDWRETNVYCVDSFSTSNLDDGISIERIAGNANELWIHIHIANPTAFFDKTHTLSGLSAHMTASVYTPEKRFPMLPEWVIQNHFSLARGRPVITFSSRVDRRGNVLETKIGHGIIQNVVRLTPLQLSTILGAESPITPYRLCVGGQLPEATRQDTSVKISLDQHDELRLLYNAAKSLWERRKENGAVRRGRGSAHVRVSLDPSLADSNWNSGQIKEARLFFCDPVIQVDVPPPLPPLHFRFDTWNITEELMILACQAAGSWCAERKLPMMYRGTVQIPSAVHHSSERYEHTLRQKVAANAILTVEELDRYTQSQGAIIAHTAPIPHKWLGVQSYVRVTSPLRRFSDMIAHWQIEATIREERRTGQKFDSTIATSTRRNVLPFSRHQMQESIITLLPRENIINRGTRGSSRYWLGQALMRAFYYKEAPLPQTFTVEVMFDGGASRRWQLVNGWMQDLQVSVQILGSEKNLCAGDMWEVKLHSIDTFAAQIFVNPLRLISREGEAV